MLSRVSKALFSASSRLQCIVKLPTVVNYELFEKLRNKKEAILIDVRKPEELEELGSIPGAHNIPIHDLDSAFSMSSQAFESAYNFSKPDESDAVVMFCYKGPRAQKASALLSQKFDFENVSFYSGSYEEWFKNKTS